MSLDLSSDEVFNKLALELFALQYESLPLYRSLCDKSGRTPANLTEWRNIPSIPTRAFKDFEITSIAATERVGYFTSSGTTGQARSRHFHSGDSLAVYEASLMAWFARHANCPEKGKRHFISLTPPATTVPNSSLAHMFATIHRELGSEASVFTGAIDGNGDWLLDCEKTYQLLKAACDRSEPVMLMGTAFNMVHLVDFLKANKLEIQLPNGSCAMETGGYKGRSRELSKQDLHMEMGRCFGITNDSILCEYGMSELSSQAYDHRLGAEIKSERVFQFPPWARFLIINPENQQEAEDGRGGLIRIFDLANIYSAMCVQTEDMGIRRGSGFELAGRAVLAEARGCSLQSL